MRIVTVPGPSDPVVSGTGAVADPLLRRFLELPLPRERIALEPRPPAQRRLLVVHRRTGRLEHRCFAELPQLVRPGEVWIRNRSSVLPALTTFRKEGSGGRVELLWLGEVEPGLWEALGQTRRLRKGTVLVAGSVRLVVEAVSTRRLRARVVAGDLSAWLRRGGRPPLPPYIRRARRSRGLAAERRRDRRDYQPYYATEVGSIAAPTAGLHFRPELVAALRRRGVRWGDLVLHVGPGTFAELAPEEVATVRVDPEFARIPAETAALLRRAEREGRRVVAVGTTTLRSLEGLLPRGRPIAAASGWVDVTLRPGVPLRWNGGLLTNFHLPHTTLRLLVAAFAGTELALAAYREALRERGYRFYSYGDAMLIL